MNFFGRILLDVFLLLCASYPLSVALSLLVPCFSEQESFRCATSLLVSAYLLLLVAGIRQGKGRS